MKKYLTVIFLTTLIFEAEAQSSALPVADSLYAVGSYTKAIENYQKISNPEASVVLQIARSYRGLGNTKAALENYKKFLLQNTNQPIAATEYGRLLITRGDFLTADSIFAGLTTRYPDNPEYYYQRGRAIKQLEKKQDSVWEQKATIYSEDVFSKAVQLDSTHQKALYQLGLHYLRKRDYPVVDKICFKALDIDPDNIEMVNILAQNYYLRGWFDQSVIWFEKLIDLGQSSPFIHNNLGVSYYETRKHQKAIDQYLILLDIDDEDYGIHHKLAELYGFIGDIDKAEYHAKKALYFKDLPLDDIYMTLGRAYQINKKFENAIGQYQQALKINPSLIRAAYDIAVCADNYYKDKNEVVKLYEGFLENYKDSKAKGSEFYTTMTERRLSKLKQELFLKEGED